MKTLFVLFFGTFLTTASFADNSCVPTDFCKDKVAGVVQAFESSCISDYVNAPKDTELQKAEVELTFNRCAELLSRRWKENFGRECGGPSAQDACYKQCMTHSIPEHCLAGCFSF
jgi:hypothetical protein